jgi:hypothetical protein
MRRSLTAGGTGILVRDHVSVWLEMSILRNEAKDGVR